MAKSIIRYNTMSILEIANLLIDFYSKNSIFDVSSEQDRSKIFPISENENLETHLIEAGLDKLEKQEIVKKISPTLFALEKPLVQYSQTVELNFAIIEAIAKTINTVCKDLDNEKDLVDTMNITQDDIANLIHIINNFAEYGQATGKQ